MKYWFDCEFNEDGRTIDLISIGIVSEDGREYSACSEDAELHRVNPWVRQNVLPKLPPFDGHLANDLKLSMTRCWKSRREIASDIVLFTGGPSTPLNRDSFSLWISDDISYKPDWMPKQDDATPLEFWAYYCVAPETRVLTADLRWVPIATVHVGDELTAFDESTKPGNGRSSTWRRWRKSVVEQVDRIERPCYDLTFDDGTSVRCSTEHRWLVGSKEVVKWVTAEQIRCGQYVSKPVDVWDTFDTRDGGYLAAALDGEGFLTQTDMSDKYGVARFRVGFSQKDNAMLAEVRRILLESEFAFRTSLNKTSGVHNLVIGNRRDVLRLLGSIRPLRLLDKFTSDLAGAMSMRPVELVKKKSCGVREVVSISTSSKTFIAEGLASHNCSYDWIALCQLYGTMMQLPKGFPKFCRDLKQLSVDVGSPQHPPDPEDEHNALADARWNRDLYAFLMKHREGRQ